jgi:hypothetical protein
MDDVRKAREKKRSVPASPFARSQRVPSLIPDKEFRELGRGEVVYGCEAYGGDEQSMEMVGEM